MINLYGQMNLHDSLRENNYLNNLKSFMKINYLGFFAVFRWIVQTRAVFE